MRYVLRGTKKKLKLQYFDLYSEDINNYNSPEQYFNYMLNKQLNHNLKNNEFKISTTLPTNIVDSNYSEKYDFYIFDDDIIFENEEQIIFNNKECKILSIGYNPIDNVYILDTDYFEYINEKEIKKQKEFIIEVNKLIDEYNENIDIIERIENKCNVNYMGN